MENIESINYSKLIFCTNTLLNGGDLFGIKEEVPLIIKKGKNPRIWLKAINNPKKGTFVNLIEDSKIVHKMISIEKADNITTLKANDVVLLKMEEKGEDILDVYYLDLRAIGFNIFGDENELTIGSSNLSGNTMSGVKTLIYFDS